MQDGGFCGDLCGGKVCVSDAQYVAVAHGAQNVEHVGGKERRKAF